MGKAEKGFCPQSALPWITALLNRKKKGVGWGTKMNIACLLGDQEEYHFDVTARVFLPKTWF